MSRLLRMPEAPLLQEPGPPRATLKWVTAVFRPERLGEVSEALHRWGPCGGLTIAETCGDGSAGPVRYYRGVPLIVRTARRFKLEVVVAENQVPEAIGRLRRAARTGRGGGGKIWVSDVLSLLRIRTGEGRMAAL